MAFLSPEWLSALAAIVLIDIVLAGDNAIVIALAARSLPPHLQRKAIIWGTVGAIAVRAVMTLGGRVAAAGAGPDAGRRALA